MSKVTVEIFVPQKDFSSTCNRDLAKFYWGCEDEEEVIFISVL